MLLSAATPTADSDVPAMKLAEAEKHNRHDPFVARLVWPIRALRLLQAVDADSTATAPGAVYNRQAPRTMLVESPAGGVDRLICATTRRRGSHDLFHADFRGVAVISRHAATDVAFGDNADQLEVLLIFNDRRAAAA